MERYEAYKDSGVEWIGEIPTSWIVQSFRWTLKRVVRQPNDNDEIVTCFRDGEVTLRKNRREDGFTMSDKEIGYQHICAGDFVIHGMDGFAGAMGISDSDGKGSPVLMAFRPIGSHDLRYINYLLRLYAWRNVFLALSTTIRVRSCDLNWAKVAPLPLVLPSYKEQQAIADYLDAKTAEIDALVADCEREVELLREYRKAVISEAVTKGLDPDAPMRDSGVEWIGEIPKTWSIAKVKSCCDILPGYAFRSELFIEDNDSVKLLRGINLGVNVIRWDEVVSYPLGEIKELGTYRLLPGDVVIGLDRPWIKEGLRIAIIKYEGFEQYLVQRVARLRGTSELDIRFVKYALESGLLEYELDSLTTGVSVPHISTEQIGSTRIALPNIATQHEIIEWLDAKTAEIDSLIEAKQSMADKLREYRRSLISEAVTGKFKVPGV